MKIGAPSYFAIMLFSVVLVSSVLGTSKIRGFIGLFMGLTIGLVGLDLSTGQARLTGGMLELADGIGIVVVAVGVFAMGEAFWTAAHLRRKPVDVIPVGRPFMGRDDWRRSWGPWLRGTALGFPFGAVPAGGAETPTFLSYITERKLAARKGTGDEFGEGAIEGVAGPEAANNASAAGMFVPLLALGLPVTATAAVLLAAMQTYGIQPGPTLLADQPDLVWTLLASLLIGNALLLVINLPLAPLWAKLLRIPRPQLYAGILFFASLGAYSVNQDPFDLALLLFFGAIGFVIRRFGIPVLPLILGVILGPADGGQAARGAGPVGRRHQRAVQRGARRSSSTCSSRWRSCCRSWSAGCARPKKCSRRTPTTRRSPDDRRGGLHPGPVRRGRAGRRHRGGRPARHRPAWSSTRPRATRWSTGATSARPGWPTWRSGSRAVGVAHEVRQAMGTDVAEEMLRVVDETAAEVLVIGLRHRTPVGKMIMGSVAQQVLLDAKCWVLAVKPA